MLLPRVQGSRFTVADQLASFITLDGTCPFGFRLIGEGAAAKCVDIDECAALPELCAPHGTCRNTPGSFFCECRDGYFFSRSSGTCEKVVPVWKHVINAIVYVVSLIVTNFFTPWGIYKNIRRLNKQFYIFVPRIIRFSVHNLPWAITTFAAVMSVILIYWDILAMRVRKILLFFGFKKDDDLLRLINTIDKVRLSLATSTRSLVRKRAPQRPP